MKLATLLREQHRKLDTLMGRLVQERGGRLGLMLQLVEELMTHLSVEDRQLLAPVADTTNIEVEPFRDEQARVRNAVLQAVFVENDDAIFAQRLRELRTEFQQHARLIEHELLPLVESKVRAADLESMGERMQATWRAAVGNDRALVSSSHAAE